MKTVYKYDLELNDEDQQFDVPRNSYPVHVGIVNRYTKDGWKDVLSVWMEVCTEDNSNRYLATFRVFGAGHPIPESDEFGYNHTGSVISQYGQVWHVYEKLVWEE